MTKNVKVTLVVVALAVGGYLVFRWYENRKANGTNSPTGALGTNLNSVAPELVGGSSGPDVGPAVQMPLTITLNETAPLNTDNDQGGDNDMHHHHHNGGTPSPVHRQRHHAKANPGGGMIGPGQSPVPNPGGPDNGPGPVFATGAGMSGDLGVNGQ